MQNSCFFKTPSSTPTFQVFIDFVSKRSVWGRLQNPAGAKIRRKIDQVAPNCQKKILGCRAAGGFVSRHAFPETIVITGPFGHTGF